MSKPDPKIIISLVDCECDHTRYLVSLDIGDDSLDTQSVEIDGSKLIPILGRFIEFMNIVDHNNKLESKSEDADSDE